MRSARADLQAPTIGVREACPNPWRAAPQQTPNCTIDAGAGASFEIYTFVNHDGLYERMRRSFVDAGFNPDAFVRLTDSNDDPYAAVTRIGQESTARYPILCHQDIVADQGAGAEELLAALQELDAVDPHWAVAGNAGVMRSGRLLLRVVDMHGGSTGESLPLPVVSLDEEFLVFNPRNMPRCSTGLSDFHLYGTDVCLNALAIGASAYVIDFPVTHGGPETDRHTNPPSARLLARLGSGTAAPCCGLE